MEALSTKTLELTPSPDNGPARARLFYGNYAYYLDRTANEKSGEEKVQTPVQKNSGGARAIDKQRQANIRRLEKQEAEILKILEELEKTKFDIEAELAMPEIYSNGEKARETKLKLDECTAEIEKKIKIWEEVSKELEGCV
jgi:ATP-binding cassette subfamily F protein 3